MPIVKGLLVSFGEKKTHKILKKYEGKFTINPKIRFFDVIEWNTHGISPKEHSYLEKTHFDFVICEAKEPYKPLFAIEFDGIGDNYLEIDRFREKKHETKQRICEQEGFPLLWIGYEEIRKFEGETILDSIIDSYIGGEAINRLAEDGVLPNYETYIHEFKPMVLLLRKYHSWIKGLVFDERPIQNKLKDCVTIRRILRVRTTNNPKEISNNIIENRRATLEIVKSASVKMIRFPHYHPHEIASDIATYLCLKELDYMVSRSEISLK